jgi:opacity protein-like surface antigen
MVRFAVSAAVAAITLVTAGTAAAQDKTSGPYLRLDAGGSFATGANSGLGNMLEGEAFAVGGGVGWRVMPQFRMDVTVGYRGEFGFSRPGGPVAVRTDLESVVGLATAYYDIVTIGGFTPYVGVGAGFADNRAHTRRTPVSDIARAAASRSSSLTPGDSTSTDFAWQVTAGVSYALTTNWSLDFGYRYVDMGTAKVASTVAAGSAAGGPFAHTTIESDLRAHEVAIGLRYSF